jgi:cytochrome b involved in lipid metabolism
MKTLVTISLFIFWTGVSSILTAGLIFFPSASTSTAPPVSDGTIGSTQGKSGTTVVQVKLSLAEIAKHSSVRNCWLLINNKVYNVTSFLSSHPGGIGTILPYCGKEASRVFATKDVGAPHSQVASNLLASYYIGNLNQNVTQKEIKQSTPTTTPPIPSGEGENEVEIEDD